MTKEDIRELLREKKGDREETQVAIKVSILGCLVMGVGTWFWVLMYFSPKPNDLLLLPVGIFAGSCLSGFTMFLILIGQYLYFQFHEPFLSIHWLYRGFVRTFIQIFFYGSFIILYLLCWRFYNQFDITFVFLFVVLSLPSDLGLICSRIERIRSWFEDYASKESKTKASKEKSLI
ncbi:MAG: hypothetical protein JSV04_01350 [Candidatus Heimdallarchaeota archaeon]|nr:MAG: hypothetical protein JSV04_01350 [Candidatus Heimdallarchaeota archaeon]